MSKDIDIEIVIDTVTLLATYQPSQDSNNPAMVPHNFSYMVTQSDYVNSGQATGDLSIKANVNDTIRWRMLSMSGNTDQTAVIYNIVQFSGSTVTSSPPTAIESEPYAPWPTLVGTSNTNPPTFTKVEAQDYFLQVNVTSHGTENYKVYFYVTKEDVNGNPVLVGYYGWDPTITVG